MVRDVDQLRQRIYTLCVAAGRIYDHVPDLHTLGWEPTVTDTEHVAGGSPDRTPPAGNPKARKLFERICTEVASMEAELVGLERQMMRLFFAGSERADDSRGRYPLLVSRAEHEALLARYARREDSSVPLVDQPQHPGAKT